MAILYRPLFHYSVAMGTGSATPIGWYGVVEVCRSRTRRRQISILKVWLVKTKLENLLGGQLPPCPYGSYGPVYDKG